jgi:predicted metalloendopeptidase
MNRTFKLGLMSASLFVVACSEPASETSETQNEPASVAEDVVAEEAVVVETGIDMEWLDENVRPQDDIWNHVNGKWIAQAEIPADRTMWGSFATLRKETDEKVKTLLESTAAEENLEPGSDAQKIRDLYRSILNRDLIEEKGTAPIQPMLDEIAAIEDKTGYFAATAGLDMKGITTPLSPFIYLHPEDTTRYIVRIYQSGLGLPSREYYLDEGESFDTVRAAYTPFMSDMLRLAGVADYDAKAQSVYDFEVRLAEVHWTNTENRDASKTNNVLSLEELSDLAPSLDWANWFSILGIEATGEIMIYQPSYIAALGTVLEETDLETLKAYSQLRIIRNYARYLPEEIRTTAFAFTAGVLYGAEEEPEPWERAVQQVNGTLGDALGKLYVEKYFPPEAKVRMDELVANLYTAFEISIEKLDWMSDETKVNAQAKRAKLGPMIGYPSKWEDYSALEITADDLIGNLIASAKWAHEDSIAQLGQPLDKDEWITNPQTVNAFFVPARNQVFFPAGYLQEPNFFMSGDDAVNYGAIGTTIGHEIGHAFDDQGRKFGPDGNLKDWWTDADAEAYKAKAAKLVEQYNAYAPFEDLNVNGELTLGENIGDLTGLTIALRAYHISLDGKEAPVIDGLTGDQRFFISYAQSARLVIREKRLREMVVSDSHSPSEYRVATMKNMPEFYEAFDVQEGDGMYIPPEERVAIWE